MAVSFCNLYGYNPTDALTGVATALWGLLSLILLIQSIKTGKHYFLIVPIAGLSMPPPKNIYFTTKNKINYYQK